MATRSPVRARGSARSTLTLAAALVAATLVGAGLLPVPAAHTDEGEWSATDPVRVDYVPDLAVDVADHLQVYAAYAGGVARSFDGGQTWQTAGVGRASTRASAPPTSSKPTRRHPTRSTSAATAASTSRPTAA